MGEASTGKQNTGGRAWPRALRFTAGCAAVVLAAVLLSLFVVRLAFVEGPSMENTLRGGDWMVVWQPGYHPAAGDIVVTDKRNPLQTRLTKRVIATGGQQLEIRGGAVYIDGEPLNEPYLKEASWAAQPLQLTVPEGQVFLMGDNRNASRDSREIGCLPEEQLMGKVVFHLPLGGR